MVIRRLRTWEKKSCAISLKCFLIQTRLRRIQTPADFLTLSWKRTKTVTCGIFTPTEEKGRSRMDNFKIIYKILFIKEMLE